MITLFRTDPSKGASNQLVTIAAVGVLVGLLLPAIQAARTAASRNTSTNNLKRIILGMLNYESAYGTYPPQAKYSADGRPLLSWRVLVLPFMEENALYQQFHLDEPWDSEHNKALIPLMPAVFLDPTSKHAPAEGLSNYLAPSGPGALMNGTPDGVKMARMAGLRDGTSNTIAVLQVSDERAVPWTKPEDFTPDAANPIAGLGITPGIFLTGFCDGHVSFISSTVNHDDFKAMLTVAGGEVTPAP